MDDHTVIGLVQNDGDRLEGLVRLETAGGVVATAQLDDAGRFEFADVPRALVRLRVELAGAPAVTTSWIDL